MSTGSVYSSYTTTRVPHSLHLVGIGKSGCNLIEAFIRTGYLEDDLLDARSRFSALAIDIGDQYILQTKGYFKGLLGRLEDRGIPTERAHLRAVTLPVPKRDELYASLQKYPEFLKAEYPQYQKNPNFAPWIPTDQPLPATGEHIPRAVAKAIYGKAYYDDKILDKELTDFAESVRASGLPPLVVVIFGFAGGTGSGMVVDLARHLAHVKIPGIQVCGLGFLPCGGDPEGLSGANLYPTFNEIDLMVDQNKNAKVVGLWGEMYRNPFAGGFMMVPVQPAWKRLSPYAKGAHAGTRSKLRVTTKFVNDCLAKLITDEEAREFLRMAAIMGIFGPPHEFGVRNEKSFSMFSINKFIHPAQQVLPGQSLKDFREEISLMIPESISSVPLREGYHTGYMECHVTAPRGMWTKGLDEELGQAILPYVEGDKDNIGWYHYEAFDLLNCFAYLVIPGVSKKDITYYTDARSKYESLDDETQKLLMHSLALELGVMVSEPSSVAENVAGKSIWGDASNIGVPYDVVSGRAPEASDLNTLLRSGIEGLIPLIARVR